MSKYRSSRLIRWSASSAIALMGTAAWGLTGRYGFTWLPRWEFWLGLASVFLIGAWGLWYLSTHRP
ncbi:MAG: hypothetical protein C7B47_05660 [Sulfobacillus thermosulfidooxidans]|uniref:Uncharacterized protein n=1 Tax=Sulfobacillus thermosulfidooxidans TaxID=28034 RepID=A0A2T2X117_SULTH|nr:MAG: hypothetical protein C7B47_05660 [Sulfobacillus thermosulfidooxidans]